MDILDLLGSGAVIRADFLASGCPHCLLEVGVQTCPCALCLFGRAVLLIEILCFARGVVLGVELLERVGEAGGEAVLVV